MSDRNDCSLMKTVALSPFFRQGIIKLSFSLTLQTDGCSGDAILSVLHYPISWVLSSCLQCYGKKSEFLEASPHPVLSGHESTSRNRKICCCCIHISCLRVGSPAVVLQSVSTCHKTFRQVSCFLSIFSITHIKCRESQKLGPLDSC